MKKINSLSEEDRAIVERFFMEAHSNAMAVRMLHRAFRNGQVTTSTPINPETELPRGWSYFNLLRSAPQTECVRSKK